MSVVAVLFVAAVLVAFATGAAVGAFYAIRGLPRMIAKMQPSEVDALADRVAELRGVGNGRTD